MIDRRLVIAAAPLLWALAVWGPADHWAAEVPRSTQRAQGLIDNGDPEAALELLDARRGLRAPGMDTRLAAGFAALATGADDRAREEFEAARRIQQDSFEAALGLCLVEGEPATREERCDLAVRLDRPDPGCRSLLARARVRIAADQPDLAQEDLSACEALDPSNPVLERLVRVLAGEEAEPDRPLEEPEPKEWTTPAERPQTELEGVRALLDDGKARKALRQLDRIARDRDPGVEEHLLRSAAHLALNERAEATRLLEAAAPTVPAGGRLVGEACLLAADLEAYDAAEALCQRAAEVPLPEARCHAAHALALSRMNQERWAAADAAFSPCLDPAAGDDALLWFDASLAAAGQGKIDLALERLREASRRDPASIDPAAFREHPAFEGWSRDPRGAAALESLERGEVP